MNTSWKCEAVGRYRSGDGRTLVVRARSARIGWALYHGDVVGPRAYAHTLQEAMEKADILRGGWDALDDERNLLRLLRAEVREQEIQERRAR